MGPRIELSAEQVEAVIRQELMLAYESLLPRTVVVDTEDQDDELLYCLQRVIEFYSSPEHYDAWQDSLRDK